MAEMNWFSRWLIDRVTLSRARKVLAALGSNLQLPAGSSVLELGSGGGGLVALLKEQYQPSRLVGTDYDPVQVQAAENFLRSRWQALPASVELRPADAMALPFPDGSFDAVFAMMMLHHVETNHSEYVRRPRALGEVKRVLRPGGQFVYSELFRRKEIQASLADLGFRPQFLRSGWRRDLAVYRLPP